MPKWLEDLVAGIIIITIVASGVVGLKGYLDRASLSAGGTVEQNVKNPRTLTTY